MDSMNVEDTVETVQQSVQDDAVQAVEQNAEGQTLESFMADTSDGERDQVEEIKPEVKAEETQTELPKGIRGRIQAAETKADKAGYERGRAEAETALTAKWEQERAALLEKASKYDELMLENEARTFSQTNHIPLEFAKQFLTMQKQLGGTQREAEKPKTAPATQLTDDRKNALNAQASKIKAQYGIDVFAPGIVSDADAKAIFEGKMDFWEIALRQSGKKPAASATIPERAATTPAPVTSGGTKENVGYDFSTMTDEEFDKFQAKIARGAVYKPR